RGAAAMDHYYLITDESVRADRSERVLPYILPDIAFDVHFNLNPGILMEPYVFHRADLYSGKPYVVAGGKPFHIIEYRAKPYAFYERLLLASQRKDTRDQDNDPQRYESPYNYRTFLIRVIHIPYS